MIVKSLFRRPSLVARGAPKNVAADVTRLKYFAELVFHDQGISSFYLGLTRLHEGRTDEGQRLIKNGTTLYPEAWLLAKANAKLSQMEANSNK